MSEIQSGARILVVSQEPEVLAAVCATLEGAGHHVVPPGKGGRKNAPALELAIDLVVADMGTSEGDGADLLLELRRKRPDLKVIALTGGGRASPVGYLPAIARFGAVCTVAKPLRGDELLDAVRWALSADPTAR